MKRSRRFEVYYLMENQLPRIFFLLLPGRASEGPIARRGPTPSRLLVAKGAPQKSLKTETGIQAAIPYIRPKGKAMTYSTSIRDGVAWLRMERPKAFNAVNREMALGLQAALDEAETQDAVRAIVLTGEGKAFCAGQDLKEATDPDTDLQAIVREHYNPLIRRLRKIEKPILAAVNGVAAGAGANLALACDIVVAKESASFIQAFSKIGLIPDSGGTFMLPRLIGWQKASALMMLGDKVAAEEAERLGMIYKVFSDTEFEESVEKLAVKLASMPTQGLGLTKRALNESTLQNLDAQLDSEEALQATAAQTEDYAEGVSAFLEKRKPTFKGK